ncbi:TetR/AcrR family transcriptional regulator [Agrococcus jejuensis]|uniref:DNA-binding transcriptional regulator, AcrR family n=1 Tax=Agrococcus jejuensis TaxID=399736 RepID=A0A1G8E981_9MICO|nr:TetR/AcrR family transcriptional regulator [Agrococcus jejuensis]SDH66456.1 DNA-binding transcriptional regulator, AcrR family [Agrococcus jejuensis]
MPEKDPAQSRRPSLRERKKLHTRRTIADAAFGLAVEHGVDGVLVEEIAERAFVSPRTLSNYFPSKEAAIVAAGEDDLGVLTAALRDRPDDEAPLASLRTLLVYGVRSWTPEQLEALRIKERLIDAYPTLLPHRMAQYDALEDAIRVAVAERMGLDAETEAHPRLVAGAAASVVKTAVRVWVRQEGDEPTIGDLVAAGFADLETGLTED